MSTAKSNNEAADAKDYLLLCVLSLVGSLACLLHLILADNPQVIAIMGMLFIAPETISYWFKYKSAKAAGTRNFRREKALGTFVFWAVGGAMLFLYSLYTDGPSWTAVAVPLVLGIAVRFQWNAFKRESMLEASSSLEPR